MQSDRSRALAVALVFAASAGIAGVAGCGSSSGGSAPDGGGSMQDANPEPDGSMTDAADSGPIDSGRADTGRTDSGDAEAGPTTDCGATAPTGSQIVASTAPLVLQGNGLTSDGYAFYEDTNTQTLYAVDSAGGAPASLGPMTSQGGTFHLNGGKAALFMPAPSDPMTSIGALSAWSKATGPTVISTSALLFDAYAYNYDVTSDGAYVLFYAFDGSSAKLTISTIDGQTQQTLVSNIDLSNQYCLPMAQFVGSSIVTYYCLATPPADSGAAAGNLTIASMPVSSNFASITPVTLAYLPAPSANAPLQQPDPISPDGTEILVPSPAGLELVPVAGGAPTLVDQNGTGGAFAPNGDVVYGTTAGGLMRYSAADAGASLSLQSSGVLYLLALSGDGNWLQFAENLDSTGSRVDIWLASTTAAGSPTQLWTQANASPIGFTTDSKYETFATNVPMTFGINTFDLYASPVSGGAPSKIITTAGTLAFTKGSKLVTNANVNKTTGAADIEGIDLSNPAAAKTLVAQADPNFFYASGPNKVVYTWYCAPNSTAGVWAVDAP